MDETTGFRGTLASHESTQGGNSHGEVLTGKHKNGHGHANGNGKHAPATPRRDLTQPTPPATPPLDQLPDSRRTLAVFCYEAPDSPIGRQVGQAATALARRGTPVHLFTRFGFVVETPNLQVHAVGDSSAPELLAQVEEFTSRASNAYLQHFPRGTAPVTLMGYEWSSIPALSLLRGISNASTILSLHSLERQRGDLSNDLSRSIADIETSGLRESGALWVHDPATAEVARYWVPECVDRIVHAHKPFPAHDFASPIDAGAIKARFEVGPVDPTIVYVGDFSERYGCETLLKSMPAVLKNHPQARLVMVGYGDLYWPMKVFARYLLLEHAVRLPGNVEGKALNELVQAADLIVVPSRESTPWWPILAGWAAQRPVVATHQSAPGLLEHEQDSVLIYSNMSSIVWGLERVIYDAEFAARIGARGKEKLEERFGWNAVVQQIEEMMQAPTRRP